MEGACAHAALRDTSSTQKTRCSDPRLDELLPLWSPVYGLRRLATGGRRTERPNTARQDNTWEYSPRRQQGAATRPRKDNVGNARDERRRANPKHKEGRLEVADDVSRRFRTFRAPRRTAVRNVDDTQRLRRVTATLSPTPLSPLSNSLN